MGPDIFRFLPGYAAQPGVKPACPLETCFERNNADAQVRDVGRHGGLVLRICAEERIGTDSGGICARRRIEESSVFRIWICLRASSSARRPRGEVPLREQYPAVPSPSLPLRRENQPHSPGRHQHPCLSEFSSLILKWSFRWHYDPRQAKRRSTDARLRQSRLLTKTLIAYLSPSMAWVCHIKT